jgi:glutamine amidotransferase
MITVVDYGVGNLGSIQNMLKRIGVESQLTSDLDLIANASKLILPGVGAFDNAMSRINSNGLREILDKKALNERIPILGICLGMQLLTKGSEEGNIPGLGWIPANARKFPTGTGLKVPHMGWNVVTPSTPSKMTQNFKEESRFYFVHSYYVTVEQSQNSILKTTYGIEFDAAIQNDNIYGAQFHPEKSHRFGMTLFQNFAEI